MLCISGDDSVSLSDFQSPGSTSYGLRSSPSPSQRVSTFFVHFLYISFSAAFPFWCNWRTFTRYDSFFEIQILHYYPRLPCYICLHHHNKTTELIKCQVCIVTEIQRVWTVHSLTPIVPSVCPPSPAGLGHSRGRPPSLRRCDWSALREAGSWLVDSKTLWNVLVPSSTQPQVCGQQLRSDGL